MKVWRVKWLWVNGMTLYPFGIIIKKGKETPRLLNHEKIHWKQQKELGFKFYWRYLKEWRKKGYRNISFEKEAYDNDQNLDYLNGNNK